MSAPREAMEVRALRGSDTEFVRELSVEAFTEFSRHAGARTLWMAEHFTSLVAERAHRQVGFAVVRLQRQPELSELAAIAVREAERGRGVGQALLRAVETRARAHASAGIVLHTADANVAALELFLKRGYRIQRRLARHYVDMFDAVELVKVFR